MKTNIIISMILVFFTSNASSLEVYKVALLESRPWAYKTKENTIAGIYPNALYSIEKNHNFEIKFDIKLMPLARIIHEAKKSQIDLTIMSKSSKRNLGMEPVKIIYKTPFVLFSPLNSEVKTVSDIKNKRVSMLIGGSGCPCIDNISYEKIKVSKHLQGLKMIIRGRADAVSGPYIRLNEGIKQLGIQEKIGEPIVYEWRFVSLWASKELSKNNKKIDSLANEIHRETSKQLKTGNGNSYFTEKELNFIVIDSEPSRQKK